MADTCYLFSQRKPLTSLFAAMTSRRETDVALTLKPFFLVVDIGFILYWAVTLLQLIPAAYLFKDYDHPILVAWNWSFLPLDLFVSATGLGSLYLLRQRNSAWRSVALISLVLTFCSGLQALAFWTLRTDFDLLWWLTNGFLLVYPLFFIPKLLRLEARAPFVTPRP